jgi:hypothetical protein
MGNIHPQEACVFSRTVRRRAFRAGLIAGCVLVSGAAAGQVVQQPPQANGKAAAGDEWLEPILARLDSDDLATRERASIDLQTDVRLTLDALQRRVTDSSRPLTAEQQLRVNEIALRLFKQTPRGAMGVSFAREQTEAGVTIGMAIDGFDAQRVLRPGDIIRELSGVPVFTHDEARAVIVSHDPGDEVRMTILRNNEPMEVTVRLGNFQDLQNAMPVSDRTLRDAWAYRCQRTGQMSATGTPIDAGLTQTQWEQLQSRERRRVMQQQERVLGMDVVTTRYQPIEETIDVLVGGGSLRRLETEPPMDFVANERDAANSMQARNYQIQINQLNQAIRNEQRMLERDPNMDPQRRQAALRRIAGYREHVKQLRAERNRLIESLREAGEP